MGSLSDEFRKEGVRWQPARKGSRTSGWEIMRRMLEDAAKPDRPGLYVSRRCEYFWQTTPYLARDPRKADDVDSRGPDHAADACRYALGHLPAKIEGFDPRSVFSHSRRFRWERWDDWEARGGGERRR